MGDLGAPAFEQEQADQAEHDGQEPDEDGAESLGGRRCQLRGRWARVDVRERSRGLRRPAG